MQLLVWGNRFLTMEKYASILIYFGTFNHSASLLPSHVFNHEIFRENQKLEHDIDLGSVHKGYPETIFVIEHVQVFSLMINPECQNIHKQFS